MFPENNESLVDVVGFSLKCSFFSYESMVCSQQCITLQPAILFARVNSCTFQPLQYSAAVVSWPPWTSFFLCVPTRRSVTPFLLSLSFSFFFKEIFSSPSVPGMQIFLLFPHQFWLSSLFDLLFLIYRTLHEGYEWTRNGWVGKQ